MSKLNHVITVEPDQYEECRYPQKFKSEGHECPRCNGRGHFHPYETIHDEWTWDECKACQGSGRLQAEITITWKPELKNNSNEES